MKKKQSSHKKNLNYYLTKHPIVAPIIILIMIIASVITIITIPQFFSDETTKNLLLVSPEKKSISCTEDIQKFSIKIINNMDIPAYNLKIEITTTSDIVSPHRLQFEEMPGFKSPVPVVAVEVEDVNTSEPILILIIPDINPHTTLDFIGSIDTEECDSDFDINFKITLYSDQPNILHIENSKPSS